MTGIVRQREFTGFPPTPEMTDRDGKNALQFSNLGQVVVHDVRLRRMLVM
jgi:hypothetical protein